MYLSEDIELYSEICAFHCTSVKVEKVTEEKKQNSNTQTGYKKTVEFPSIGTLRGEVLLTIHAPVVELVRRQTETCQDRSR